jgi:hypothetical protein
MFPTMEQRGTTMEQIAKVYIIYLKTRKRD